MSSKTKIIKRFFFILFMSNVCVTSTSAKGWAEESSGFIGYFTHVRDFYLHNNRLEFHCLEYQSGENNEYVIKKADWLGQDASSYLYGSRDNVNSSTTKYTKLDVLQTNNNITVAYYYDANREFGKLLLSDYTLHPGNVYPSRTDGATIVFESATSDSFYKAYTSYNSYGSGGMYLTKYRITPTAYVSLSSFSMSNYQQTIITPTDGIEVSDRNILLGSGETILKLYYNGKDYVVQNTVTLPTRAPHLKFFKLDNGSIFAYTNEFNKGAYIIIYKLDSNGNILKTYACPYHATFYSFADSEVICKKTSSSFLLPVDGSDDSYFNLLEFDDNLNLVNSEVLITPSSAILNSRYNVTINNIKYINKQLYVIYEIYGIWTNYSPNSYYAVYKPIPPTATITPQYTNIGDNTPITLNIAASESYPILSIFNEDTQQGIYWGAPENTVSYLWTGTGSINLSIRIHDSDGSLLSKGNTVTINKKDVLNNSFAIFNNNSGLQQVVIISDVDRYYENNISNRNLVNQLVSKSGGVFLIFNNVSPVLAPLLK